MTVHGLKTDEGFQSDADISVRRRFGVNAANKPASVTVQLRTGWQEHNVKTVIIPLSTHAALHSKEIN